MTSATSRLQLLQHDQMADALKPSCLLNSQALEIGRLHSATHDRAQI